MGEAIILTALMTAPGRRKQLPGTQTSQNQHTHGHFGRVAFSL
jgi:hypothetical protein